MKKIVCHVITSLRGGGAEANLVKLVINEKVYEHIVISLIPTEKYSEILISNGIKVFHLNFEKKLLFLFNFIRLLHLLKNIKPDLVQTWLYHSDLIGGLAAKICMINNIVWNIRSSHVPKNTNLRTYFVIKLCAFSSWFIPKKIITCANSAKNIHKNLGYCAKKFEVIFNGFERPNLKEQSRDQFFSNINLKKEFFNIVSVGRYSPQKNHTNLLNALIHFRRNYSDLDKVGINLIFIGKRTNNILEDNKWFDPKELNLKVVSILNTNNIYKYFQHMDLSILCSSYGEAFPNVLAESMICGTPCIATDVGDSKLIIGDAGWLIPTSDSKKLSKAIYEALITLYNNYENKEKFKKRCISKISSEYTLNNMLKKYNKLYEKIICTSKY